MYALQYFHLAIVEKEAMKEKTSANFSGCKECLEIRQKEARIPKGVTISVDVLPEGIEGFWKILCKEPGKN